MTRRAFQQDEWRYPEERAELVEAYIAAERRCRLLERALREWAEHVDQDPANGSYVAALLARIEVMERNIERLTRRKAS